MILNKFKVASSTMLIASAILHTSITYADDSEVFFGSEQYTNVAKPNIIFLLDYSTSMRDTNINGTSTRRIEGLRDAVTETLLNTSLRGVRVGVMKYPHITVGSDTSVGKAAKLVYPVVDIDALDDGSIKETAARSTNGLDDAHQPTINGSRKNVSVTNNVMLMGDIGADYNNVEREFDLDVDRYNTLFLLPRVQSGSAYDSFTYSNAISYVCSLVLDDEAEFCQSSIFNTTGTGSGKRNHVIEKEIIDGESRDVITGLNGTGYNQTGYGDQALFIFKGVNIPSDATIKKAHLIITPKKDGFYKSNGNTFCTLNSYSYKGEAEWLNWRVSSARNFPAPNVDSPIYNTTGTTSDFNFYVKAGATGYSTRYWGVRQNQTTWNNDIGGDADSAWGSPQDGAYCWWQENKKITLNITTAIQEALNISTTDKDSTSSYRNNFKSEAAASGAPMADLAIRFWTGGGTAYSKPYHTIGAGAPKLKLTYSSNQTGTSTAAVRFNNVYIPQGATITKAKIKMIPAGGNDKPVTLRITGEKTGDAKEFNATSDDFSRRNKTSSSTSWPITDIWKTNAGDDLATKYVETPDIKNVLSEIVQAQEWCGGQSVAFFLEHQSGNGYRSAFTYDQSSSFRPVLEFEYTGGETGCMTKTWEESLASRSADGYQTGSSSNTPTLSGNILYAYSNYRVGAYFSNLLIKNPVAAGTDSLADKGLVEATLQLVPNNNYGGTIQISLDNAVSAERLKVARNDLGQRTPFAVSSTCTIPASSRDIPVQCDITNLMRAKIQQNGWQNGNGLVVLLHSPSRNMQFKPYDTGYANAMKITFTARQELMAPNSLTIRRRIVNAVNEEEATVAQTPTMPAMLDAARYISNYPSSNAPTGPYQGTFYWNGQPQPSPLLSSCQATHLVLMSDGSANVNGTNWRKGLVSYTGRPYNKSTTSCEYNGRSDGSSSQMCGQALVNFMSTTSQGLNDDGRENWVTTHAVAFGSKSAGEFLQRLVNANSISNKGRYFYAETSNDLVNAFMDIMDTAKGTFYNYTSGQVAISNENRYIQRREIYYSLMEPSNRNHWAGNMKRFGLVYKPTTVTIRNDDGTSYTTQGQKAILVDSEGVEAVFQSSDGYYFIDPKTTSWWYTGEVQIEDDGTVVTGDGGDVHRGGVLGKLADNPDNRNMYVMKGNTLIDFKASNVAASGAAKITPDDMQVSTEEDDDVVKLTKGYVNFLRGFAFTRDGEASVDTIIDKKDLRLGDFAHSAVNFVNYGQCSVKGQENADPISCDASYKVDDKGNEIVDYNEPKFLGTGLQQVALLAGNDGFFRAFDVTNGEQLYAIIPSEMLPIIPELEERKTIGLDVPRLYALDGTVHIYHDDQDNDGYVNNNERAIAYVATGRGGRALYAIDISSKTSPSLLWKIEGNKGDQFNNLGYTWSTPVTGKMQVGTEVRNVVIFGGGYDPQQDDMAERTVDYMGNEIYILDAVTGGIIWKADQSAYSNMKYSIPSSVTTVEREVDGSGNKLISDIFVGDMGGQLWRFTIDNGAIKPVGENGVIARVGASGDKALAQRIYMPPAVYEFVDSANKGKYSVNIGTGYLGHPLVTYNKDKFYSFRFNVRASDGDNTVLTEASMVQVTSDTIKDEGNSISLETAFNENGFYVNFGAADPSGMTGNGVGEKMISSMSAARNVTNQNREEASVFFNTYVPNPNSASTCRLASGWQRAYGFNLVTGESYFGDSLFRSSVIIGIPPGVNTYCEGNWCTPVWNYEDLATGSEDGNRKPFQWKEYEGSTTAVYKKMSWTDLFDPEI